MTPDERARVYPRLALAGACWTATMWLVAVHYGRLVLRLCRSCYEFFLRAIHPEIYVAPRRVLA